MQSKGLPDLYNFENVTKKAKRFLKSSHTPKLFYSFFHLSLCSKGQPADLKL